MHSCRALPLLLAAPSMEMTPSRGGAHAHGAARRTASLSNLFYHRAAYFLSRANGTPHLGITHGRIDTLRATRLTRLRRHPPQAAVTFLARRPHCTHVAAGRGGMRRAARHENTAAWLIAASRGHTPHHAPRIMFAWHPQHRRPRARHMPASSWLHLHCGMPAGENYAAWHIAQHAALQPAHSKIPLPRLHTRDINKTKRCAPRSIAARSRQAHRASCVTHNGCTI